jgi:hypothetical protein
MANFSFVGGQTGNTYTDATQASMIHVIEHAWLPPPTVSSHLVMVHNDALFLISITGVKLSDGETMAKATAIVTYE